MRITCFHSQIGISKNVNKGFLPFAIVQNFYRGKVYMSPPPVEVKLVAVERVEVIKGKSIFPLY